MTIAPSTYLDLRDVQIVPAEMTQIRSRNEINVYDANGNLPLFTAPMDTVVDEDHNYELFKQLKIIPMVPRVGKLSKIPENKWMALSLHQFEEAFMQPNPMHIDDKMYICIDIANGHMAYLVEVVHLSKQRYGDKLQLMVGNIANPETYCTLTEAGADYIRVGIGNGAGCLTTLNTGVGMPMATLIADVYEKSCRYANPAYIVADGGAQGYDDIIKELALGADYVMIGSIFNRALESAGTTYDGKNRVVDQYHPSTREAFKAGAPFQKVFWGMSTKDVQRSWGRTNIRTSEGVTRRRDVEYTLDGWVENFQHYLSTAMSYTGALNLSEFIGKPTIIQISNNAVRRIEK